MTGTLVAKTEQKIGFLAMNGQVFNLMPVDAYRFFTHRIALLFFVFLAWFAAVFDLYGQSEMLHYMERMGLWLNSFIVFVPVQIAMFFMAFHLMGFIQRATGWSRVIFPINFLTLATVAIVVKFNFIQLDHVFSPTLAETSQYLRQTILGWLNLTFLELVIVQFVLKRIKNGSNQTIRDQIQETFRAKKMTTRKGRMIIANIEFLADDILFVGANGRLVEVFFKDGSSQIHQGYLGKLAANFDEDYGTIIHRSYWVNFFALEKIYTKDRRHYCQLVNKQILPLSRNRVSVVKRDWNIWRHRNIAPTDQ